jgi:hypothetical protein
MFHSFAEMCMQFDMEPEDFVVGTKHRIDGHLVEYDDDMVMHMQDGLAYLKDEFQGDDWTTRIEEKVKIEEYTLEEDGFGTADFTGVSVKQRRVVIFDWKYGLVAVCPIKNEQATIYGLGTWETFAKELFGGDPKDIAVEIVIEQPRASGGGGTWVTTMEALLETGEYIKEKAALTYDKNAPRIPGEKQCKYCKHAVNCDEWTEHLLDYFGVDGESMDDDIANGAPPTVPNVKFLTPERRSHIIRYADLLRKWTEKLVDQALLDYDSGLPVPEMKMVMGRAGFRKYRKSDADAAEQWLVKRLGKKDAYVRKPLSPAQAEKLIGKEEYVAGLKKFVTQNKPKRALVVDTDGRETLSPAIDYFD